MNKLILAISLLMGCSSLALARNCGDCIEGTLIVLIPCKDGLVIVSDKLAASKTTNLRSLASKIQAARNEAIIGAVHASTVTQNVNGKVIETFSASSEISNYIEKNSIDLSREFPAIAADKIGKRLIEKQTKALSALGNKDELLKPFGSDEIMFLAFSVNLPKEKGKYEIVTYKVFTPKAGRGATISKGTIDRAIPLGRPETVEAYAKAHKESPIAKALALESEAKNWRSKKAFSVAFEMIRLTNKAMPEHVGDSVDGALLNTAGKVVWFYKNQKI